MTPHTLEEQKALLTAEAEGQTVYWIGANGIRGPKCFGEWVFGSQRYEVERPLMEEWLVVDKDGDRWGSPESEAQALAEMESVLKSHARYAPFRAVHMREVR